MLGLLLQLPIVFLSDPVSFRLQYVSSSLLFHLVSVAVPGYSSGIQLTFPIHNPTTIVNHVVATIMKLLTQLSASTYHIVAEKDW